MFYRFMYRIENLLGKNYIEGVLLRKSCNIALNPLLKFRISEIKSLQKVELFEFYQIKSSQTYILLQYNFANCQEFFFCFLGFFFFDFG